MRRLGRNRAQTEEEESVFVTMTDMTISFLLIIMILLAFFATQINEDEEDETVPLSIHEAVRNERDQLSNENETLNDRVDDLQVTLKQAQLDLDQVMKERDSLIEDKANLLDVIANLEAEISDLEDKIRELEDELREKINRIEELLINVEILAAQIKDLRGNLEEAETKLAKVTKERDQLIEDNSRLENKIIKLEAEIKRLLKLFERFRESNPLEAYLSEALVQRREILVELRDRLKLEFPDLEVLISPEQDALRFQGEGLFRSGSSQLQPRQRKIVDTMGRLLDEILLCFTLGDRAERGPDCGSGNALIEAVQIEGHTDSDGLDLSNLRLSTKRANATLLVMLDQDRTILAHENLRGQPVMSVSGYGEMRPIATNATTEGKAANRRIDLRIIMYAPSTVEEVEAVGRRLDALRATGEAQ